MSTPVNPTPRSSSHHPAMIIAAIAIILFCLVGTAAILGWLPSSVGGNAKDGKLSEYDKATLSAKIEEDKRMSASALALAPSELPPAAAPKARKAEPAPEREPERASNWCSNCGNVESVRAITQRAEGSGLGAAGGAVLGGLLGNQIGGGNGRKLATVAGAVGGAVVGNQVEGNMKATTSYEIKVRLDDGSARTFHQQSAPRWAAGDRVKIVKGALRSA